MLWERRQLTKNICLGYFRASISLSQQKQIPNSRSSELLVLPLKSQEMPVSKAGILRRLPGMTKWCGIRHLDQDTRRVRSLADC